MADAEIVLLLLLLWKGMQASGHIATEWLLLATLLHQVQDTLNSLTALPDLIGQQHHMLNLVCIEHSNTTDTAGLLWQNQLWPSLTFQIAHPDALALAIIFSLCATLGGASLQPHVNWLDARCSSDGQTILEGPFWSSSFVAVVPGHIFCVMLFVTGVTALTHSCAGAGQLCIVHTIRSFGALLFATVMTTRQFVSILLSCIVFWHPLSLLQW